MGNFIVAEQPFQALTKLERAPSFWAIAISPQVTIYVLKLKNSTSRCVKTQKQLHSSKDTLEIVPVLRVDKTSAGVVQPPFQPKPKKWITWVSWNQIRDGQIHIVEANNHRNTFMFASVLRCLISHLWVNKIQKHQAAIGSIWICTQVAKLSIFAMMANRFMSSFLEENNVHNFTASFFLTSETASNLPNPVFLVNLNDSPNLKCWRSEHQLTIMTRCHQPWIPNFLGQPPETQTSRHRGPESPSTLGHWGHGQPLNC
jgi:hypothetical protein